MDLDQAEDVDECEDEGDVENANGGDDEVEDEVYDRVDDNNDDDDDEANNVLMMAAKQRRILTQSRYKTASTITFDGPLSRKQFQKPAD
jgi:hypothetical protein